MCLLEFNVFCHNIFVPLHFMLTAVDKFTKKNRIKKLAELSLNSLLKLMLFYQNRFHKNEGNRILKSHFIINVF